MHYIIILLLIKTICCSRFTIINAFELANESFFVSNITYDTIDRDNSPHDLITVAGNGSYFNNNNQLGTKLLAVITAFHLEREIRPVLLILQEYGELCSVFHWNVNVVIQTSNRSQITTELIDALQDNARCGNTSNNRGMIGVQIDRHPYDLNIKVAEKHRLVMKENIHNYDLFVYQEADMIFTSIQLLNYVHESQILNSYLSEDDKNKYSIGFYRYRSNDFIF